MTITSRLRFLYIFWGSGLLCAVEFFFESWHTSASQPTSQPTFKDASCY